MSFFEAGRDPSLLILEKGLDVLSAVATPT
jgi:hypothetical protein